MTEQEWLATNLARLTRLLQGQRDLEVISTLLLKELVPLVAMELGAFYLMGASADGSPVLRLLASYAHRERRALVSQVRLGEGLVGKCAVGQERVLLVGVPGDHLQIGSALGDAQPLDLVLLPVVFEGKVMAVLELASLSRLTDIQLAFLDRLAESLGLLLDRIAAGLRQEELQRMNLELRERSALLQLQKGEVERKNQELERARNALEERAQQLVLASKHKSELLANMSHEIRTPLNSMLVLAKLLSDNMEGNLDDRQIEVARTIHSAGSDLLALINDILDISRIESGRMGVDAEELPLASLRDFAERSFGQQARAKALAFQVDIGAGAPEAVVTDARRLQQILRNLLANALKFTDQGSVRLDIRVATSGWSPESPLLCEADTRLAFSVSDTGIGIPLHKQRIIFEAFQQGDRTTNRKYGGTGLGLSISRQMAKLIGGEIVLTSIPGAGSTFTLYLPRTLLTSPISEAERAAEPAGAPEKARGSDSSQGAQIAPVHDQPPRRKVGNLPKLRTGRWVREDDPILRGRKILVVDDDVRNTFAIANVLESEKIEVIFAENGRHGLDVLGRTEGIDAILMDVMMPEMDGYETMREVRKIPRFARLPILALTAIAMKGDRERCIAAGASEHLPKPINSDHLLSILRIWLSPSSRNA